MNWKTMAWIMMILLTLGLVGCVSAGKDASVADQASAMKANLDALKDAGFKGSVRMNLGGSPLGINQCTSVWLGPQQSTLAIEGDIDFKNVTQRQAAEAVP